MRLLVLIILTILFNQNLQAANSLSYSGRLVQSSGAPVTGPVNLRAELVYTNATSTVLCSQNLTSVALTKGVFHLKLDLNCSPKTMTQVLSETPNGESVAIRIIDQTNSKSYPLQAIHSVPFSKVAEQLPQMGASNGQALAWDGAKWAPTSVGTGNGTVMSVNTGTGLTGGPITTSGTISVAAGGITSTELAANSVTASKINAGEITSTHISATANIPYSKLLINDNEIPAIKINGLQSEIDNIISSVITNGDTTHSPSGDAVFDALQLKFDKAGGAINPGATITGLPAIPLAGSEATSKDYVDNRISTLTTTNFSEGSNLYFSENRVRATVLTGFDNTLPGPVTSGDNLVQAFGRTQKQLNDLNLSITGNQWSTDGSNIYRSSGNVGIGTSTPFNPLMIGGVKGLDINHNGSATLQLKSANASGTHSIIMGLGSRGTISSPTVLSNNDYMLQIMAGGYHGSGFDAYAAGINFINEAVVSGQVHSSIGFNTSNIANADERMRITSTGNVGIGLINPTEKLEVAGNVKATQLCIGADCRNAWPTTSVAAGSVTSTEISDGTIVNADIADNSISPIKLSGVRDTTKYLKGDNTWSTFATDAINSVLSTFTVGTGTKPAISNTDSVVGAFGKVQKTLNDINSDYVSKTGSNAVTGSFNLTGITSFLQIPTSTGAVVNEAANVQYVQNYVGGFGRWTKNGSNIHFNTGNVGIGNATPAYPLSVNGVIETTTGGFRFPDGSVQTTAASNSLYWSPGSMTSNLEVKSGTYAPIGQLGTQLTTPTSGSVDDGFYTIALPFAVNFNGVDYSTIYVGTNSYVTFGSGTSVYSSLGIGNPALNKILINSADRSSNSIWFNSNPTNFSIRYEGGCGTTPGTALVWELSADSSNNKKIVINVISMCSGGYSVVANPTTSLGAFYPAATTGFEIETLANPVTTNTIYNLGWNVGIGTNTPSSRLTVQDVGSTTASASLAVFTGGTADPLTNIYGIGVGKNNSDYIMLGYNKNSVTGNIPASSTFITGYQPTSTISIGRGSGTGLPSTSDIFINSVGNVGVGTTTPTAKLQVNGEIKLGNTSSTCNASTEGQQRYNATTKLMEFCNGTSWLNMNGSRRTVCSYYNDSHSTQITGQNIYNWTTGNCTNGYPSASCVGSFSKAVACGNDSDWAVLGPNETPFGGGTAAGANGGVSWSMTSPCNGVWIRAVYECAN